MTSIRPAAFLRVALAAAFQTAVQAAPVVGTPPAGGTFDIGVSRSLTVAATGSGTLGYQWFRGTATSPVADLPGATDSTLTLPSPAVSDTSYYGVRVTDTTGSISTTPVLVVFARHAGASAGPALSFSNTLNAILPLSDGSLVFGGAFTSLTPPGGSAQNRSRLAHVLANGTIEPNTTFPIVNGIVESLSLDSSGRLLAAGTGFVGTTLNGVFTDRKNLLRLNLDHTLDTTFTGPFASSGHTAYGLVADGSGRVYFAGIANLSSPGFPTGAFDYLARLDASTGALDTSFHARDTSPVLPGTLSTVRAIHQRSDGKLLVAHNGGVWLLNLDGTRDTSFAGLSTGGLALLPLAGGDVIVATSSTVLKLNSSGATVAGFPASPVNFGNSSNIVLLALPNGDIALSGSFNTFNGNIAGNIAFLNADGSPDTSYAIGTGFNNQVMSLALDSQNRLLSGGFFTTYQGAAATRFAIIQTDTHIPADPGAPVITAADTLDTYLANAGVPADQRGPNDDPDHDGLPNLLEYALGFAPNTITLTGLPGATVAVGNLTLTYKQAAGDITYTVEANPNLTNPAGWSSSGVNQGTPDGNGNTTATIPATGGDQFLRLKISR